MAWARGHGAAGDDVEQADVRDAHEPPREGVRDGTGAIDDGARSARHRRLERGRPALAERDVGGAQHVERLRPAQRERGLVAPQRRAERQKVAEVEKSQTAAVRVLENEHVLSIAGAPVQVWPKLRDFWATQGYKLELDDVDLGVIETGWSEDKAKLSRDKFKLFAEAGGEAGTTVLYLSHEGQELTPKGESLEWQRKPRDVEAERQMVDALQALSLIHI